MTSRWIVPGRVAAPGYPALPGLTRTCGEVSSCRDGFPHGGEIVAKRYFFEVPGWGASGAARK